MLFLIEFQHRKEELLVAFYSVELSQILVTFIRTFILKESAGVVDHIETAIAKSLLLMETAAIPLLKFLKLDIRFGSSHTVCLKTQAVLAKIGADSGLNEL